MSRNSTFPRCNSLAGRCLARMLQGEILMHRYADRVSGTYRLAGYIHYLQSHHHWPIERRELVKATPDPIGRAAPQAEYWLSEESISWAGEEGRRWAAEVLNLESRKVAERAAATARSAEKKCAMLNSLAGQLNTNNERVNRSGEPDGSH